MYGLIVAQHIGTKVPAESIRGIEELISSDKVPHMAFIDQVVPL